MSSQIAVVMTGDEGRLVKAFQRANQAQEKMSRGFKDVKKHASEADEKAKNIGRSMQTTGKLSSGAFAEMSKGLADYATNLSAVTVVAGAVTAAIQKLKEDTKQAVKDIEVLADVRKAIAGRSESSGDFQRLKGSAERIATTYGLSETESYKLVDSARAGGFEGDIDQVAMAARTFASVEDLSAAASIMSELFQGEGITPSQGINAVAAADKAASQLDFKQATHLMQIGAQGATAAGSNLAELGALASTMSTPFGQSAGERIRAFGTKVSMDESMAGQGIMGAYDSLRAMPEADRQKWLGGNQEIVTFYQQLEKLDDEIRNRTAIMQQAIQNSGTANSEMAIRSKAWLDDPEQAALMSRDISANRLSIAKRKKHGVAGLTYNDTRNRVEEQMIAHDRWSLAQVAALGAMDLTSNFTSDPGTVAGVGFGVAALAGGDALQPWEWQQNLADLEKSLKEVAPSLAASAKNLEVATSNYRKEVGNATSAARREAAANRE